MTLSRPLSTSWRQARPRRGLISVCSSIPKRRGACQRPDTKALGQIVVNLLVNAQVKFTDKGEVVLSVDSKRMPEDDGSGAQVC